METPKAMGLWSAQGDHAGFMLLAPASSGMSGECVFMLSPVSVEGIESDLGVVVSELKVGGEHRFEIENVENGHNLTVFPSGLPQVEFCLDHNFKGGVFSEIEGKLARIGSAEPLHGRA